MSFAWRDWYTVAHDLARLAAGSATPDAYRRMAIGRAYYAAFALARERLRLERGSTFVPRRAEHQFVIQIFRADLDPVHQRIADDLELLRDYRQAADYEAQFPDLEPVLQLALLLTDEVLYNLDVLPPVYGPFPI